MTGEGKIRLGSEISLNYATQSSRRWAKNIKEFLLKLLARAV
jgi:hypothetical protein